MKQIIALILCLALMLSLGISAFAAGTDDGTLLVADKNGEKFFGTKIDKELTKYVAANGSDQLFYDANGDKDMDICDLVAISDGQLDLDENGSYTAADTATLRLILIGGNN